MTDRDIFLQSVPADAREDLAFSRWQENMRIGTHSEGCDAWGRAHYECAMRRIAELEAQLAAAIDDANREARELDRVNAQLEAAKKDTARYQWLRNDSSSSHIGIYRDPHSNCRRYLFSAEADTFIDAAMQPKEQV